MKTTFLDYYKMILDKVSFDHNLLIKEYRKAMNTLSEDEAGNLNLWLKSKGHKVAFISDRKKQLAPAKQTN